MKTQILIPVTVPFGDYCVSGNAVSREICQYFDNEGGHPTCDLDRAFEGSYDSLKYDDEGNVPKLTACLKGGGTCAND